MDAAYYLALALKSAPPRDVDDDYGSTAFAVVARDLLHSIEHWMVSARSMLDPNNWNLEKLLAHGRIGKPHICLYAYVTTKDNLVIEWRPDGEDRGDFRYFSDSRYGYQDPENRLVMIHGFERLRDANAEWNGTEYRRTPYPKHITYLFEALEAHIHSIRQTLSYFVDIKLTSDLRLEYEGATPYGSDGKLVTVDICDLEQERKEQEQEAKEIWLKSTFSEDLACPPDVFLQKFKDAGSYAALARDFAKNGKRLSPAQLRTIVKRLTTEYPELVGQGADVSPLDDASQVSEDR
jgi:hypothetical protein